MFIQKLKTLFLLILVIGSITLVYLWYEDYKFNNTSLDEKTLYEIKQKELELQNLTLKNFKLKTKFPIIISDKIPSKIYGMATVNKEGKIIIYLNKKRFQENKNYMINDVLPHEYAHALMFALGDFTQVNGGHTKKWEFLCKKLEGQKCNRFVDNNDILIEKVPFIN